MAHTFNLILVLFFVIAWAFATGTGPASAESPTPRHERPLDTGWRFLRDDPPDAEQSAFDDAAWETVSLPHCWNVEAGQTGDKESFYRGAGWYRREERLSGSDAGKSLFLRFDGAYAATDVYVNGAHAGRHEGGFAAFCFDVTSLMKPGRNNLVAVRVHGAPEAFDGPPAGGDFTKYGGLYRKARLLVLEPLSISPMDDASPGVYLRPTRADREEARVTVTTMLRNAEDTPRTAEVRCTVLDHEGRPVAESTAACAVPARGTAPSRQAITMQSPRLWDGRDDPYLYTARVEVLRNGTVTDRVEQPLGLRTFHVDPERGFFLNGRPYPLHGVCRHQDRQDRGWAITRPDMEDDLRLIREIGANCVRTAHYQHADEFQDLCDREGLVLWSELCLVDSVRRTRAFHESARRQLRALIKQNINHPSIAFWGLWNEVDFEGRGEPNADDLGLLRDLHLIAKDLDPSRLTTAASNLVDIHRQVAPITDLIGWNGYPGWYVSSPDGWDDLLDTLHAAFPGRPIGVSEYGAGASIHHHEQPPSHPKTAAPFHPEEWQCAVHEGNWRTLKAHPELWATFIWNMFDFSSLNRREGDTRGRNDKGLVTYERRTRKDAFFFYKAQWTDAPMVHITSRRFSPRPSGPTELKVYSNCPSVELFLDGVSLGTQRSEDRVFRWERVNLPEGTVHLEAVGRKGRREVRDAYSVQASRRASPRLGADEGAEAG